MNDQLPSDEHNQFCSCKACWDTRIVTMPIEPVVQTSNGLSKVEECREAFEKYLGPKAQLRKHNGYYDAPLIESAWNDFQAGWLASRSAETGEPRAPSGHVGGCMCSPCREWRLVQYANTQKAKVVPSICGKPMPDGKGAGQCINPPGHEGDCDDMPF